MARNASTPAAGAGRDFVRTLVAGALAWLVGHFGLDLDAEAQATLVGAAVLILSPALAGLGKSARNLGVTAGRVNKALGRVF